MEIAYRPADRRLVLRYLGAAGWAPDAATAALLDKAEALVRQAATPRGIWRPLPLAALDLQAAAATSPATCRAARASFTWRRRSRRVDALLRRLEVTDIALCAAADATASAAIEPVCDAVEADARARVQAQGNFMTGRYSPGYGDCPLDLQAELCRALDTPRGIGLTVTPQNAAGPAQKRDRHPRRCRPSRCRGPRWLRSLPAARNLRLPERGGRPVRIEELFDRRRFILDGGMGTQLQQRGLQPGHCRSWPRSRCRARSRPSTAITPRRGRTFCWPTPSASTKKSSKAAAIVWSRPWRPRLPARTAPRRRPARWSRWTSAPGRAAAAARFALFCRGQPPVFRGRARRGGGGADLIVIETMTDLYELKAALLAAKKTAACACWLP